MDRDDVAPEPVPTQHPAAGWLLGLIGLFMVLFGAGAIVLFVFGQPSEPIPPEIAADPLLARGREIYLERCVACHGATGQGDGPLAKTLTPRPRNLANDPWKHGEKPEQVLAVLANGVKDAQMPAWAGTYGVEDLKAVAAYVYQIARKPIPDELKK